MGQKNERFMSLPSGKPANEAAKSLLGRPPRGAAYDYTVRSHIILLAGQGLTSYEISERTGVDSSVIRRWIRRYRAYGLHSLQPFWRPSRRVDLRAVVHADKDRLYRAAYAAYVQSLEPVASITRRFNLDYHSFKYHVERYHPELVAARARICERQDFINNLSTMPCD